MASDRAFGSVHVKAWRLVGAWTYLVLGILDGWLDLAARCVAS